MEKNQAAVIGYPIKHSLSPKLHNYWLEKYGIEGEYKSYEVKPEELESFLLTLKDRKLVGVNVTVPHKEDAYKIVKKYGVVTEIAEKVQAINTVYYDRENNKLTGTNTDYYGFKNSFINQVPDVSLSGKKILIIGAGGAARAIIAGLLGEGNNKLTLVNRTKERADSLNEFFDNLLFVEDFEAIEEKINKADIIVNTTICGLKGKNDFLIDYRLIKGKRIFYDIVYNPLETVFLKQAKEEGHIIVTGIGMLIHQAVPAFEKFFGIIAEVEKTVEEIILI